MPYIDVMTVRQVAERLKVNNHTFCRLVAAKEVPDFKVGGSWRFRKGAIDRWTEENAVGPESAAIGVERKL